MIISVHIILYIYTHIHSQQFWGFGPKLGPFQWDTWDLSNTKIGKQHDVTSLLDLVGMVSANKLGQTFGIHAIPIPSVMTISGVSYFWSDRWKKSLVRHFHHGTMFCSHLIREIQSRRDGGYPSVVWDGTNGHLGEDSPRNSSECLVSPQMGELLVAAGSFIFNTGNRETDPFSPLKNHSFSPS